MSSRRQLTVLLLVLASCGGIAVIDPAGSGGEGVDGSGGQGAHVVAP